MTCIVGIADGKNVWIGGDSCGSNNKFRTMVAHPKVFYKRLEVEGGPTENALIGGCGSFRMLQLLEFSLQLPKLRTSQSPVDYLVNEFADTCRAVFKEKGLAAQYDGVESMTNNGSSFLIGFRGVLYTVWSDYQAFASVEQEAAVGCGDLYAIGSLHTSRKLKKMTAQDRIVAALEASSAYDPFVCAPYHVLKV